MDILSVVIIGALFIWIKLILDKRSAYNQKLKQYLSSMIIPCNIARIGDMIYIYNAATGEFLVQGNSDELSLFFEKQDKVYTDADGTQTISEYLNEPVTA